MTFFYVFPQSVSTVGSRAFYISNFANNKLTSIIIYGDTNYINVSKPNNSFYNCSQPIHIMQ